MSNSQSSWALFPVSQRATVLRQVREAFLNHRDELLAQLSAAGTMSVNQALFNEFLPAIHQLTYWSHRAWWNLRDRYRPFSLLKYRVGYETRSPLGRILVLNQTSSTLAGPLAAIIPALLAGNEVLYVPSEPLLPISQRLQSLFEEGGLLPELFQVRESPSGALPFNESECNKVLFLGPVGGNSRETAEICAKNDIPFQLFPDERQVVIVLSDADLDLATSGTLWVLPKVQQLLIHDSLSSRFTSSLHEKMRLSSGSADGMTCTIDTFRTPSELLEKTRRLHCRTNFSIFARDTSLAEQLARQLPPGLIAINEVAIPVPDSSSPAAPSLESFIVLRRIHRARASFLEFKSPWWHPESQGQAALFQQYSELYRSRLIDKIRAFPLFLWHLVHFVKTEKRL